MDEPYVSFVTLRIVRNGQLATGLTTSCLRAKRPHAGRITACYPFVADAGAGAAALS